MPDVVFSVDQGKSMREQAVPGHNRWHPDIPVAAMVRPGDEFRVECREWTDAQLGNNDPDIEVIVKRALVYAAALGAIVAIYAAMLGGVQRVWLNDDNEHNWIIAFLATLVALLLAPPVKSAVQNVLDRAFYRDRYDYRRALVGFARDLNSDLDLHRLSERLVSRVTTLPALRGPRPSTPRGSPR